MELKSILESLIFASDKPLTVKQLKSLTGTNKVDLVRAALEDLEAEYRESGIQLTEVGGGYQFRTHPENAPWVKRLLAGRPPRLTQAMLETLAIIAYRQPITRPEMEDIRGVDCGGVLRLLLERSLIRILGKKEEVGRPILYGTTRQFLEFFNLNDLQQLPTLKEFTELSEEMAAQLDGVEGMETLDEVEPQPSSASAEAAPTAASGEGPAAIDDAAADEAGLKTAIDDTSSAALRAELDQSARDLGPDEPGMRTSVDEAASTAIQAELEQSAHDQTADDDASPPTIESFTPMVDPTQSDAAASDSSAEVPPGDPTVELIPPVAAAAGSETFAAGQVAPRNYDPDDEDDEAITALDDALAKLDGVLRAHRRMERAARTAEQPESPDAGRGASPGSSKAAPTADPSVTAEPQATESEEMPGGQG